MKINKQAMQKTNVRRRSVEASNLEQDRQEYIRKRNRLREKLNPLAKHPKSPHD